MGIHLWIINCFSLSSFKFLSVFNICHFNRNESWCESLCFLHVDICLLSLVREVFRELQKFSSLFSLFLFLLGSL